MDDTKDIDVVHVVQVLNIDTVVICIVYDEGDNYIDIDLADDDYDIDTMNKEIFDIVLDFYDAVRYYLV